MKGFVLVALIAILAIGGPTVYYIHSNQMIANMVADGASPAEAQCSMNSDSQEGTIACLTAALLRSIEGKSP